MTQLVAILEHNDTRHMLELFVIEPILQHILARIFPYFVIVICLFSAMFIFTLLTLVLLWSAHARA